MKRFVWLILLLFLAFTPKFGFAQNAVEMPNLTLQCINATNISETKSQHFVQLDGSGFAPNLPIEIWRDSQEGFACAIDSLGDSLCNNPALSAKNNGKEFQILSLTKEQVVADEKGEIHIAKVRTRTKARLQHNFYGAQKTPATSQTTVLPESSSDEYGLKLLTFLRQETQASPSGLTNCATVFFDPYGRVFDSVSLEPINNATVWLLDSNKTAIANQPGVTNPNLTTEDGSFSFFVPDGTYYLSPKMQNYTFPITEAETNKLLSEQSIYYELYRSEPIIQQGAIQHRDIPMKPQDTLSPTNTTPHILDKNIKQYTDAKGSFQKISGVVSHPLSIVNIYTGTRLIGTTIADNKGVFEISINNNLIDQTLPLDIIAEKVILNKTISQSKSGIFDKIIKPVLAETSIVSPKVSLSPKTSFLIGFVYAKDLRIMPNTTIEIVIPKMDNQIYATVKSDINGFVLIPKTNLPQVDYILRVKNLQNQTINTQTPHEFVTLNKRFLEQEKINLLNPEPENLGRVVGNIKENGQVYTKKYSLPTPTIVQPSPDDKNVLPIYILLTVVVVIAIGFLILQLNKFKADNKNQRTNY